MLVTADVRPDEGSPGTTGRSALMKHERIAVEVKKTRKDMDEKMVDSELIKNTVEHL